MVRVLWAVVVTPCKATKQWHALHTCAGGYEARYAGKARFRLSILGTSHRPSIRGAGSDGSELPDSVVAAAQVWAVVITTITSPYTVITLLHVSLCRVVQSSEPLLHGRYDRDCARDRRTGYCPCCCLLWTFDQLLSLML
jgi:hypothetical protein